MKRPSPASTERELQDSPEADQPKLKDRAFDDPWRKISQGEFCSPPFPIHIRRVSHNHVHLCGGEKLVKLGMGVAEKHDHLVLAFVIVPDMALVGDVPVRMPDPVPLNDLRGRPY